MKTRRRFVENSLAGTVALIAASRAGSAAFDAAPVIVDTDIGDDI